MRIAINTRFLLPDRPLEGLGWYTLEVCRELVRQHPEDEFFFLFDRPYDERFLLGKNVTPIVVGPQARHPAAWLWWFEVSVKRILEQYRIDVFFSPDNYVSLRSRVPTLVTCHDLAYEHYPEQVPLTARYYYPFFFPRYLQRAEAVVTISEYTRKDLLERYELDPKKVTVAANGTRRFSPLDRETIRKFRRKHTDGAPYFFYVGAIQPRKNIARLIRAFDKFKETGSATRLVLGGRMAWQTGEVETALNDSPYRSDILLPGFISDAALPQWLGAARAFVYPSLFEGFGLPVLESMSAGVPVLTSDRSSLPEVAGEAALLVDPHDTDAIAAGLLELDNNETLRKTLIERGQTRHQQFTWAETATRIYRELQRIA